MPRMLAVLLLGSAPGCFAQATWSVSLSNGVQLQISNTPTVLKVDLEPASGDSFYRIFRDENDLAVFAYEVQVDRTPDGDQFQIFAKPAETEFAARFPYADGGKPTPTLSETLQSPLLAEGGEFTVPIPTEPGLNENLVDTIQIQITQGGVAPTGPAAQNSQLRFSALKVYVNGKLASPRGPGTIVSGRYAMFYLPGRGAYVFSSEPVPGSQFAQIGSVSGTTLEFMLDNDMYSCKSDAQILLHSENGQIWVYHDPSYRPSGNWTRSNFSNGSGDQFFAAASDSIKWWLP